MTLKMLYASKIGFLLLAGEGVSQLRECSPKTVDQLVIYLKTTPCQLMKLSGAQLDANISSVAEITNVCVKAHDFRKGFFTTRFFT